MNIHKKKKIAGIIAIAEMLGCLGTFLPGAINSSMMDNCDNAQKLEKENIANRFAIIQQDNEYKEHLKAEIDRLHTSLNLGEITADEFNQETSELSSDDNIIKYARTLSNGAVRAELQKYDETIEKNKKDREDYRLSKNILLGISGGLAVASAISLAEYIRLKKEAEQYKLEMDQEDAEIEIDLEEDEIELEEDEIKIDLEEDELYD